MTVNTTEPIIQPHEVKPLQKWIFLFAVGGLLWYFLGQWKKEAERD
jgi:hypothetical protein